MARFKYSGRSQFKLKNGVLQAPSRREAMIKLRNNGIRVIEIEEVPETIFTKDIHIGNPVKLQHLVIFLRQFATLLQAGVTIVDATNILAAQTDSKHLSKALTEIELELREGHALSDALAKHHRIFDPLIIHMVGAGEISGTLDETLERLGDHFEKQHHTRQKVISAMTYPLVVGFIAISVVIFLLLAVVPTFVSMFADFGAELPAITRFVLSGSIFLQKYWFVLVLLCVLIAATMMYLKRKPETKYYLDYALLRIPVFGKILQKELLVRVTRTLGSMFSSSVPILQALHMIEKIVGNEVMAKVVQDSRKSLEQGRPMAEPMKNHWAFPPLVSHMIAIGEETGSLDKMLEKVAEFYEKEVETATDQLKSLIEPVMIVILAGLVGLIVSAIVIPMFDIFNTVQTY
ncbi:type II secretion system F family protein [Pseudogracilibacillus auburnensis]|uniref:type II secretion system F family protein n=1 Tax=Pseudogracilibacillus auburnensis TaxID=1494959 RepID=UPI001A96ADDB|nr:type II secretion system F family protein [Pseudogracilibacillus auburnensis]MBO1005595.1 type II secretion system F family protein [Pseudogracilibacillus auburnensis]